MGFGWFEVRNEQKYAQRGLKFLKLNLKSAWSGVTSKARTPAEGVGHVLDIVKKKCEDLVGPMMQPELKLIKKSLNSRRRVNRCFDLLGAVYDDYPSAEASGSEAISKRKRGSIGGREPGAGKRGRGGQGRGSSVERATVTKVSEKRSAGLAKTSSASAHDPAKSVAPGITAVAPSAGRSAPASSARRTRIVPGLQTLPVINVESDDEDEEEEGDEGASDDDQSENAGSSSERVESDGEDGDSDSEEEDVQQDVSLLGGDESQEIGHDGLPLAEGRVATIAILSHPAAAASRFKHRRVHIIEGGEDVAIDDDDPAHGQGKHTFGCTGRSGLVRLAAQCGTDKPKIDLFTSPDLMECHLFGNEEERRFLGGVFRRISIPKAEYAISRQRMDETTKDIEVNAIRSLLLARGARIRHGNAMAEYKERLGSALECEKKATEENESLKKKVQELETQIEKNKDVVTEASGAMNRIIDLRSEVDTMKMEMKKLQKSHDDAVARAEGQAKEMDKLRSELSSCMLEAKALIDAVFAKGGMEASDALSDADPKLFAD